MSVVQSKKLRQMPSRRPPAGRPTREQAKHRHDQLLDHALDVFLETGYELTTIEMIRVSLGMTKRTIYNLYDDKKMLFRAAVRRAIERWTVPVDDLRALETPDLRETLTAIAWVRLRNSISPLGLKLHRIVNAESFRFTDIGLLFYELGTAPTLRYLADLLQRFERQGKIVAADPELLAGSFLTLVVGGPTRGIIWGAMMPMDELKKRVEVNINLFLYGVVAH
jgi:TetR/AcrR family transcriptional repressor of mexJK operon